MTKEELVKSVIWSTVMQGTAWRGWTDRAREALVAEVQESVLWALGPEGDQCIDRLNATQLDEASVALAEARKFLATRKNKG